MSSERQSLIDRAINELGGKWMFDDARIRMQKTIITRAEFEARKAERQNKPDWKDAPKWANWVAQDEGGFWFWYEHEPVIDDLGFVESSAGGKVIVATMTGEVIGDWRDTLEQKPNHIVESDEKAAQELKFAETIKDVYPGRAAEIYCKHMQSAIDSAEVEKAVKACERAFAEFFPEAKLGGMADWYDYEAQKPVGTAPNGAEVEVFKADRVIFAAHAQHLIGATGSVIAGFKSSCSVEMTAVDLGVHGCHCIVTEAIRPLDWDRLSPKPGPEQSPELSFHLSNAFNELQASARLLPDDDARKPMLVSLANGVNAVREGV